MSTKHTAGNLELAGALGALAVGLLLAGPAAAEGGRSAGDMTDAERETVVTLTRDYDQCLRREAQAFMTQSEDVRVIADTAAERCEPTLTALQESLAPFEPEFQEGLVRTTRDRSLRRLLPEIIEVKAASANQ